MNRSCGEFPRRSTFGDAISVVMYGLYGPDSGLGNAASAGVDSETVEWRPIDSRGELLGDRGFDGLHDFHEGLARAFDYPNYGFIDMDGKFVVEPRFAHACDFKNGMARVQESRGGKWGFIDRLGRLVIPAHFDQADDFQRVEIEVWRSSRSDVRS